jgi:hypothetical protein
MGTISILIYMEQADEKYTFLRMKLNEVGKL